MIIAYLTSQYPAASHTFIRREIAQLRRIGLQIATYSIRRPSSAELTGDDDREEYERTTYVLPARAMAVVTAHLSALLTSPGRYVSVLWLALRHRPPGLRSFVYALIYFTEALLLARSLRQAGVGHVHNHFANPAAIVGMLSARLLGLPFSFTIHGVSEFDYPAGLLLPSKIEAAQFVICASWFVQAQAMRTTCRSEWTKFQVVRCGLDLAAFPDGQGRGRDPNRPRQVICVGRLSAEKGLFGLLAAISGTPQDVELLLVGDGPQRRELEEEVRRLQLGTRVTFVGTRPENETKAAIAQSDLLVLPSFMEGLPVVLMEAMALGIPVIAPHVAGIPELITDGEEGLLFRPSDWEDLREKIVMVLSGGVPLERMKTKARQRVEQEFDIRGSAAKLAELFIKGGVVAGAPVTGPDAQLPSGDGS